MASITTFIFHKNNELSFVFIVMAVLTRNPVELKRKLSLLQVAASTRNGDMPAGQRKS
jgi:alkyl hydroperoxide reductase subunit AhpC